MDDKEILWKLGQKIKKIREEKGMQQIELSVELGYDKSNTSRLESGRINPRFVTLYNLAKALDVSIADLVTLE